MWQEHQKPHLHLPVLQEVQERAGNKGMGSQHQAVGARLKKFWRVWDKKAVDPLLVLGVHRILDFAIRPDTG